MAQGDYLQGASASTASAREQALTLATVPAEDSFMVAVVAVNSTGNVVVAPDDWEELDRRTGGGASQYSAVYVKRCRPHENLQKRYVWRLHSSTAQRWDVAMAVYEGPIGEIDVISADVQDTDASLAANTVTTAGASERVIYLATFRGNASLTVDCVPPAEVTQRQELATGGTAPLTVFIGDELKATAGTTSARTFTCTNNVQSTAWTLALSNTLPADGGQATEPLTISPMPDTTGYTTITPSAAECDLRTSCYYRPTLVDTTDYVLDLSNGPFRRPIWLEGGRNIVISGGRQIVDKEFRHYHGGPYRRGVTIKDSDTQPATDRIVHIEGLAQEGVSEGFVLGCPTAAVRIANHYLELAGNRSTALQGKEQRSVTANPGILEYQGEGWSHVDGIQSVGGFRELEYENFHVRTPSTALRQDDDELTGKTAVYKHGHIEAIQSFLDEEDIAGSGTDVSVTITSAGTTKYSFAANVTPWAGSGSTTVSHGTAGADQVNGANSMKVTHPGASAISKVIAFANLTAEDWSDKSGIAFDAKWIAGGGYMPKLRVDVTEVAGTGLQGLSENWHLGEERILPLDGSAITVFAEFPDAVLDAVEMVRIVMLCDDFELGPHTFAVNNIRTADGYTTRQFDGPTGLYAYGSWAMAFGPGGDGYATTRIFDVYASRSDELSNQDGDSRRIREWDWDTLAYVLDPLLTAADDNDFFYPPPTGTAGAGQVKWAVADDPSMKITNQGGTDWATVTMSAPPEEFVTLEIAGTDYENLGGYTSEGVADVTIPAPVPSAFVLREAAPDAAAVYFEEASGAWVRAGHDEQLLGLVDYSFTSTREGGFQTLDASIVPNARDRHPLQKFQPVRVVLDSGEIAWEGRVDVVGEVSDSGQMDVAAIGHAVLLSEAELTFLGVSNDLGLWGDPPQNRVKGAGGSGASVNSSFQISSGEEGISITMEDTRNVDTTARGEAWWGKHGILKVAEVQYIADEEDGAASDPEIQAYDQPGGSPVDTAALDTTLSKASFTPSPNASYVVFRDKVTGDDTVKTARQVNIFAVSVFGDHDLPRHAIHTLPDGLYFSDVIRHLAEGAGVAVTRYGETTIYNSSDPSPNLAWLETTTIRDILDEALTFEPGFSWGVWEGPTLHYGPRHRGSLWEARRSHGAVFEREGETAETEYSVAVVNFENRDGRIKRAGPPGWGCDVEDTALRITDFQNPAVAHGVDKPLIIDLGQASDDKAVEVGELGLREAQRRHWSGDVRLPRFAIRDGLWTPTLLLRADDVVLDAETGRELPVAAASYTRSSELPATATIDTPANRLDAALAEFEARPRRVNRRRIRRKARKRRQKREEARK
jgi:hypothetical protein